ncbi:MAG: hypothetical protein QOF60_1428 [Actinomycetota bacterium]|nr:hypothetical protein [Actinomycetota bacterium]
MAVGAAAAVVAIAIGIAWATGRGNGKTDRLAVQGDTSSADDSTTTTSPGPTTTFALVPLTTGKPVPNAEEPPPSTQPPSASPAQGPPPSTTTTVPPLNGKGAVLGPPPAGTPTRAIDKAKGCNSAADSGWRVKDCGALRTMGTVLVWVVEERGSGLRALVLKETATGSNQWAVVQQAIDDAGSFFSAIGVRGEDVSGDGEPELAFGFHRRDQAKTLAVDLVHAANGVVVHRDLAQGSARLAKGELGTWSANPDGSFDHASIRFVDGAWRVAATERVDRGAVPPSML